MTQSTALGLIRKWRKRLNLTHWSFGISAQLPSPDNEMEIVMTPTRQFAAIRVSKKCWKYSDTRFEKLLVHEMLHPLFDPVVRAYDRVVDERSSEAALFDERIETTLDHIANVLYNMNK